MMKKQMNKNFKLGDVTVAINKVTTENVVLKFTGKEHGFVTLVEFNVKSLQEIYRFISKNNYVSSQLNARFVDGLRMKHREYTRCDHETEMTFKYHTSDDGGIHIVILGGHCMISITAGYPDMRHYRTIAFNLCDNFDVLEKLRGYIGYQMGEAMMRF